MRKFLEILTGSRGEYEGVEVVELDVVDLESYVKKFMESEKESCLEYCDSGDMEDTLDYIAEFWGYDLKDDFRVDIGLGEESGRVLIDVEFEGFVKYCEEKGYSVDMDWNEVSDNEIEEIMEMFIWG